MKNRLVIFGGFAALVMVSCSTDLEITAPYKDNAVVYALLDKDSTTHYVRIKKAFLGPGNAFEYAQVPDSSEFQPGELEAVVQEVKNGTVTNTYPLSDTVWAHDEGIFAGPTHKLYYFNANLDSTATYRLEATARGVAIQAETPIVGRISPAGNILSQPLRLVAVGGSYVSPMFKFGSADHGRRYDVSYRFRWDDVVGTDTISRNFTQSLGTVIANGYTGGEQLSINMDGEAFFQTVGIRAGDNSASSRRIFRGVDLIWAVAGPDLYNYLQLGSPISGIVEERPTYSNVDNGYGLFSTRRFFVVTFHGLNAQTGPELAEGQYTAYLNFCLPGSVEYGCE